MLGVCIGRSPQILALLLVRDRDPNFRHNTGFEPPLRKSIGRNLIEECVPCALLHRRADDFAGRCINLHKANAAASDVDPLRLVRIIRDTRLNCYSLRRRERRHI